MADSLDHADDGMQSTAPNQTLPAWDDDDVAAG
jgi:hypothetical protein